MALDEADDEGLWELGLLGELLGEFFDRRKGGQIHRETMPQTSEKSIFDDDKAEARFLPNLWEDSES